MEFKNYKIPDLTNKTIIITGANSGIGFYMAKQFANKNAKIIFACRNKARATKAIKQVINKNPNAQCHYIHLDLNSFRSIKKFANIIKKEYSTVDILINNAGVIMQNSNKLSKDGFEPHIATNCLGPLLLTHQLLDCLKNSNAGRIVTVSSCIEKVGYFNLKSFPNSKGWQAYSQSKIANLMLSYELDKRLKADGISNVICIASHPGLTDTPSKQLGYFKPILKHFSMPLEQGAMSTIIAATSNDLKGGEYIGYNGMLNLNGSACLNNSSNITKNPQLSTQLWDKCIELIK